MSLSAYQASVESFKRSLTALSNILDKSEAHAQTKKIEPSALLTARLYPDMFTLTRQVQAATDQARAVARLAGAEPPKFENTETTFAELKARIANTIEFLGTLATDKVEAGADQTLSVPLGGQVQQVKGADLLLNFITPNFFFHLTAAYAVLRHNGVEVGKRDFLGMR